MTTVTGLGVFWKLLFRWKASIYKVVWYNLLLYVILYFSLSLTYRFLLTGEHKVIVWWTLPYLCHVVMFADNI